MAKHTGSGSNVARVEVLHDAVGPYRKGAIVQSSVFGDGLQSLIDLGAVRDIDADDDWDGQPTVGLNEAIHSSSPPTLPNAPHVDASADEVRQAMGGGIADNTIIITAQTRDGAGKAPKDT